MPTTTGIARMPLAASSGEAVSEGALIRDVTDEDDAGGIIITAPGPHGAKKPEEHSGA